ncbi:MAG: transposase [Nitrolancea sp.]
MSLGEMVRRFKSLTTREYGHGARQLAWPPFNQRRLWQRNYFEHVVRDDRDADRIQQYIADNPANWPFDLENPQRLPA